ncbi:MAG: hypothetical protein HY692_04580 [Cyanobacteria bacterium NC_groundwater_1444_Ag_S-0.65um_54_12]|nr:hypothetical protein [Cyanobacteria bacterium NC_groundwater_1444_Ag_S-0.65um_54_12]
MRCWWTVLIASVASLLLYSKESAGAERPAADGPPGSERSAEKLPIALPALTIEGRQERPDVASGSKLAPIASTTATLLPATQPARATLDLLQQLQFPVPPPAEVAAKTVETVDRLPYTAWWGGLGGLPLSATQMGRYDLGLYHGQRWGPVLAVTDLAILAHDLDRWSSWRLQEQLSWSEVAWATLALRRAEQAVDSAWALQQGASSEVNWTRDRLTFRLAAEGGQVSSITARPSPGIAASATTVSLYDIAAQAIHELDLGWEDHLTKLELLLGQQGASGGGGGWASPHLRLKVTDFWIMPEYALSFDYGLGLALARRVPYLDPALRVQWQPGAISGPGLELPSAPTQLWASLQTETRLPNFEELYQGRMRMVGNAELYPQRAEPKLELGIGHRFSERWYANVTARYLRVKDWIYPRSSAGSLWQPWNFQFWQSVYEWEALSQFLWSEQLMQQLSWRLQKADKLGQLLQTVSMRHDSAWLDGRLQLAIGTSLNYILLGAEQNGVPGIGSDWLADWQISYRLTPLWQVYLAGNDWHVIPPREPAAGYFATPALISAGIKANF